MNTWPYFVREKTAGMTGCNFAVAETGTVVVYTNEGNADLSANVPPLCISPRSASKRSFRRSPISACSCACCRAARSARRSRSTTSHFRAPRPGTEMHYILVDNGRSERLAMDDFWFSLKCVRCGACMTTCPVYRRSGGLSYGGTYSEPIGAITNPTYDLKRYSALPFAFTMNGSCTNVCPVKANIHEQINKWRAVIADKHEVPFVKQEGLKMAGRLLASPTLYRNTLASLGGARSSGCPTSCCTTRSTIWGHGRDLPEAPAETFHEWYKKNRKPAK